MTTPKPFRPPEPPPEPPSDSDGLESATTSGEPMTILNRPPSAGRKSGTQTPASSRTSGPIPVTDRPTDPGAAGGPPSAVTVVHNKLGSNVGAPATVVEVPTPPAPEEPPTPLVPQLKPILRVIRGEQLGAAPYVVLPGKNFIGRSTPDKPSDIDLTIQERVEQVWASRQHAVVTFENNTVTIEDLNSLNGTFVNRTRLYASQPYVLKVGDIIQIGTVQLRYEA